jgi:hypothetical protein
LSARSAAVGRSDPHVSPLLTRFRSRENPDFEEIIVSAMAQTRERQRKLDEVERLSGQLNEVTVALVRARRHVDGCQCPRGEAVRALEAEQQRVCEAYVTAREALKQ